MFIMDLPPSVGVAASSQDDESPLLLYICVYYVTNILNVIYLSLHGLSVVLKPDLVVL